MSNNRGLAEQLPTLTGSPEQSAHVRPKVLRRPAQFTDTRPQPSIAPSIILPPGVAAEENEDLSLGEPLPTAISTARLWQDDARFGIAMLTIVVLVNIGLIAWLPHMRPTTVPAAEETPVISGAVTTPAAEHALTFYTKPGADPAPPIAQQIIESAPPRILGGADSGPNQ